MRKLFFALFLFALVGCSVSEIGNDTVIILTQSAGYIASIENTDTKVYADTDLKLHWNAGDEISVFSTTMGSKYVFDGQTGNREGTFSLQGEAQEGNDVPSVYAVYPYSGTASISEEGVISLELPEVQRYAVDSFGPGANTMVAVAENKTSELLPFKNLCGYVVVRLFGTGIVKSVSLRGNDSERLTGSVTVAPVYGQAPEVTVSESGGLTITLDCGEGVALGGTAEEATAFWFVVPPVTFSQGFTVTVTNTEGQSLRKTTSVQRTVERNIKYSLATIEASVFPIAADVVEFEDANFKAFCVERFDTNGDGEVSYSEAEAVDFSIFINTSNIYSLKGIERFVNLTGLYCSGFPDGGKLSSLEVRDNIKLTTLDCSYNRLSNLDPNTKLTQLNCSNNQLSELDVSNCLFLSELNCINNPNLIEVWLWPGQTIESLVYDSSITTIKYKGVSSEAIKFSDDNFRSYCVQNFDRDGDGEISLAEAHFVTEITVDADEITTLSGIEYFDNLETLTVVPRHTDVYGVGIDEDWRGSGYTFDVYNGYNTVTIVKGKLARVDLSHNTKLKHLDLSGNLLTSIDLSGNNKLEHINLSFNIDLDSIVLGSLPSLKELCLTATSLTSIDLSNLPNLMYLSLDRGESVGTIDLSHNTKLWQLNVDYRGLTSLDVSNNVELEYLYCAMNDLTELDVTHNTKLSQLYFGYNRVSSINLSNNSLLEYLGFQNNCIQSIDLTNLPVLQSVHIGNFYSDDINNTISEIDLSNNPKLERLFTTILDIHDIDVSDKENLVLFQCCYNNLLEEIDVSKSMNLVTLDCHDAPSLTKIYISPGQEFNCDKDNTAHFYYKDEGDTPYSSTDYSKDGEVKTLQTATRGNGIDLVLMGDAFTDRLINDGTYDRVMEKAMEAFFSVEPYSSFRDMFNVYSVTVVSPNDFYGGIHETALSTEFGEGTQVGGDDGTVFEYAKNVNGFDGDNSIVCVVMNEVAYAGTCYLYNTSFYNAETQETGYTMSNGSGAAIAYLPLGTSDDVFMKLVRHEVGGHGFAKLGDEYFYAGGGAPSQDNIDFLAAMHKCGWYTNIDTNSTPETVLWGDFLSDNRYQGQGLGIYQGAFLFETGVYRPTEDSIMNTNEGQYNAPSRKAIYNRINKLAYGDEWQYDHEAFVEYDAVNRAASAPRYSTGKRTPERILPPLHAPVVKNMSWKDVKPMKKPARAAQKSVTGANYTAPNCRLDNGAFSNGAVMK